MSTELKHYPEWDVLSCGCKVTLVHEGGKAVVWMHPCSLNCENVVYAKEESKRQGKPWQYRRTCDN